MTENPLPKLITFDGGARSGKGTIAQTTKDYLRDERGYSVMLIDAGQVFRVLVVAAAKAGVNVDDPAAIDAFLSNDTEAEKCVQLVKDVYRMEKAQRDALLYTNEIGANSAKIGARPLSQAFKDSLLQKWLRDARAEGYQVVLLDGRALEETGNDLMQKGLCDFVLGLYFTCDPVVAARRTLGFAGAPYAELTGDIRTKVDELVQQIAARNQADSQRAVQPVLPPAGAPRFSLPETPLDIEGPSRPMYIFDTSAELTREAMSRPVADLVDRVLQRP